YLLTWVGGWLAYSRDLHHRTSMLLDDARQRNVESAEFFRDQGLPDRSIQINPQPASKVHWCVPLFPGVLLANSSYHIAPLWAEGGMKIVVYYGFGTLEIPIFSWRA